MWPEWAYPVNTKATKKTRTESRTAGKGQKKERPRVPHKAKVSEPLTVTRSSQDLAYHTRRALSSAFVTWESRFPLGGRKGGNLSFFQVAAALAAKLAAAHPAARRKGRRKSRPRRAAAGGLALTFRLTLWQAPRVAPSQRPEGGQRARLSIVRSAHHR